MARKPRIHFPGAVYHVILRGNGGKNIFFSKIDRVRFFLLLQQGIERYKHRIIAYCLMSNHVHLIIQVDVIPLAKIMHNLSFRYTRHINQRKKQIGHLFQGRYKALLVDADNYLLELVRYIHCNPIRARMCNNLEEYQWSSHHNYLGKEKTPWLDIGWVLSQFSENINSAQKQYQDFILAGLSEPHRCEFHKGQHEPRILGDERFSERALAQAKERYSKKQTLRQLVTVVCREFKIKADVISAPGKTQPAAQARAVLAFLVQDSENITLTDLGVFLNRDITSLSRSAARFRDRIDKQEKMYERLANIRRILDKKSECQA